MFKKLKEKIADAKLHYGVGFEMAVNDFSVKLNSVFVDHEFFSDDFFDDIEEKLMELDIVPNLAIAITTNLQKKIYNQRVSKDAFDKALKEVMYFPVNVEVVELKPRILNTEGSKWNTRIRSGNTHQPEVGGWTAWQNFDGSTLPVEGKHRFVQLEYNIDPGTGNSTPKILGLDLKSKWQSNCSRW